MKKLLHIIGSPRKETSYSEAVAQAFVDQWVISNPNSSVETIDLWKDQVPTFNGDKANAKLTFYGYGKLEGKLVSAWDLVVEEIDRFKLADVYVISVPMWNGGIPWALKNYIDTVTQAGYTFNFDEKGYTGLLENKKAFVTFSSGVFAPGMPKEFGLDFQVNYMNWWLETIGVSEIHSGSLFSVALSKDIENDMVNAKLAAAETARKYFS